MLPETLLRPVRLEDPASHRALSVRALDASVRVDGPLAETTLTVTFTNDLERTLEGDLVVPLPPAAALTVLEVAVGPRRLSGRVRPRERARVEYRRAVEAGQTAALGETEGEDLARMRIAPIAAGEDVVVTLGLGHVLLPTSEGHRLVVPLTYMPRFVEDEAALRPTEKAALERPRPILLAARATVAVAIDHEPEHAPRLRCPSHATRTDTSGGTTRVRVEGVPLDRDLVLEIGDRPTGDGPSAWLRHDPGAGPDGQGPTTALAILPPPSADDGPTTPRLVTFLVDRSGSMNGAPMKAAIRAVRGALRALEPEDRFNVIAFDDRLEALAPAAVPFDDVALQAADAFLASLAARGGTRASFALAAALGDRAAARFERVALAEAPRPDARHRVHALVLMTDGDVAGSAEVLAADKESLADTRVHVLGIGDAVNHGMLGALAEQGGGSYTPVATDEDLERALVALKNALAGPIWTSLRFTLEVGAARAQPAELEPATPLDLYAGRPLLVAWRGALAPGARLAIAGQAPNGDDLAVELPLAPALAAPSEVGARAASRAWALLRNRRLTYRFDPEDDPALEKLGVAHGLVNRAVALVGVHTDVRGDVVAGTVPVVLPLPRNVAERGFPGPAATAGAVQSLPVMARAMAMPAGAMPAPAPPLRVAAPMPLPGFAPGLRGAPPPAPAAFGAAAFEETADAPAPAAAKRAAEASAAPDLARLTDDDAGLRALVLHQRADGSFDGSVAATLLAVLGLVARGHTAREGLFRPELRRTLGWLRARAASALGDELAWLSLGVAALTMPHGEPAPAGLPAAAAAALEGAALGEGSALRAKLGAALAAVPPGWRSDAVASALAAAHALG
ncbi:MAG: VWA domain-containing protein [Polyangiaceae bacterium]|nr:VWA domain-containing protein [Polyangiaceae bacterium]